LILIVFNGRDLRREPIDARRKALAKLLRRPPSGLQLCEQFEGEPGALYATVCALGLARIIHEDVN
jgi:ATP-dependent DNA ligase